MSGIHHDDEGVRPTDAIEGIRDENDGEMPEPIRLALDFLGWLDGEWRAEDMFTPETRASWIEQREATAERLGDRGVASRVRDVSSDWCLVLLPRMEPSSLNVQVTKEGVAVPAKRLYLHRNTDGHWQIHMLADRDLPPEDMPEL